MEKTIPFRLDASLAICGSPIETDDCMTVRTSGGETVRGDPQLENTIADKNKPRNELRNSIIFQLRFFIPENPPLMDCQQVTYPEVTDPAKL